MSDISKSARWTGRALSAFAVLFLCMDGGMKLFTPPFVVEASAKLGYAASLLPGIGAVLLVFTALYVIPRTSVLGTILLTGYLGGAVASNIRAATPAFNGAFPIAFAVFIWAGLWLRDARVRALLPFTPATPPVAAGSAPVIATN